MAAIIDLVNSIEPLTTKLLDTRLSTHGYLQVQGFFQASSEYELKKYLEKNYTVLENTITTVSKDSNKKLLPLIDDIKNNLTSPTYASIEKNLKYIWSLFDIAGICSDIEKTIFDKYKQKNQLLSTYDAEKREYIHRSDYKLKFIKDVKEFYKLIDKYAGKYDRKGKALYFRGHRNCNYNIEAYISRKPYYKNEFKIFNETQVLCSTSFEKCHTNLQRLAMMQHYEVPTRLLDISTNPLVALFFAVCAFREDYGKNLNGEVLIFAVKDSDIRYDDNVRVRVLSALPAIQDCDRERIIQNINNGNKKLRKLSEVKKLVKVIRKEDISFKNKIKRKLLKQCILVKPIKNNNRMLRQSGVFFICGLSEYGSFKNAKAISKYRIKNSSNKRVICIIPNECKKTIYRQLEHLKINNANLYPEIENVAKYLREKYEA